MVNLLIKSRSFLLACCFRVGLSASWIGLVSGVGAYAQSSMAPLKISSLSGNFTGQLDDADLFGVSSSNLGDLDGDGVKDIVVGASSDDDGGTDRGALWVLFLNPDGTVKSHQKISSTEGNFTGSLSNNDRFGYAVANIGDLDKDGVGDLAVGAVYDGDGGYQYGAVYILFLQADGTVKAHQKISSVAGNFNVSLTTLSSFGSAVTGLGDLNGDNILDIAVGAYRDPGASGGKTGALFVLFLNNNGTVKDFKRISEGESGFSHNLDHEDYFASSLGNIGDLNRDGVVDLAVSAHRDDDGGTDKGAIYLLFLQPDGTVKSTRKISSTSGNFTAALDSGDYFGGDITSTGLPDANNLTEIIVNATKDDDGGSNTGAIYRLLVDITGVVDSYTKISELNNDINLQLDAGDGFGSSITITDDLNDDGEPDLIVGAATDDDGGTNRGALYLLFAVCLPIESNAGADRQLCEIYSAQLGANDPPAGQGEWSAMLGDGIIADINNPGSMVQDLSVGKNAFIWTITNEACVSKDTVFIEVISDPESANAGEDQVICDNFTYLAANSPSILNTGHWSLMEGSGSIANVQDPETAVSDLSAGRNVFLWEVSTECETTYDTVEVISHKLPAKPNAGTDQQLCQIYSAQLEGNDPLAGQGKWSIMLGGSIIADKQNPESMVHNLSVGKNAFIWTITNETCVFKDTVIFEVISDPEPANAGEDHSICDKITYLTANDPSIPNTGRWSVLEGSGSIANVLDPETAVSNLAAGRNVFLWEVANACETTYDTVEIISYGRPVQPFAGEDFLLCHSRSTTLSVTAPEYGQGSWRIIQGSGKIQNIHSPVTQVNELSYGNNSFVWKVNNGICPPSSDTVSVFVVKRFDPKDIPNAFTPNNDKINDFWKVNNIQLYPGNHLNIFNRWGKLVYEKETYLNQWNGDKLPAGTYYYILDLNACNLVYRGWIQILY